MMQLSDAVSYTHLDVYKRQELGMLVFEKLEQFQLFETEKSEFNA